MFVANRAQLRVVSRLVRRGLLIGDVVVTDMLEELMAKGVPRMGSQMVQDEIEQVLSSRFPCKPYCLVEEWTILRPKLTPAELERVRAAGCIPLFVYASSVAFDSQGRFRKGDWVRSSIAIAFFDGYLIETRNTVYVLIGEGCEQSASLKTIFSIC